MLTFWVCLFVSTEAGLGAGVGFNVVYVLLRQVFTGPKSISFADRGDISELQRSLDATRGMPANISDDIRIFRFKESFFFPNAYSIKVSIMDSIQTHHTPVYSDRYGAEAERNWSVQGERRVARLRKKMKIADPNNLPPINVVVLDFTKCNHLDATAIIQLKQFVTELELYGGKHVELRFTGMSDSIRLRLERAQFEVVDDTEASSEDDVKGVPKHFANVAQAVLAPRRPGEVEIIKEKTGESVEHIEEV